MVGNCTFMPSCFTAFLLSDLAVLLLYPYLSRAHIPYIYLPCCSDTVLWAGLGDEHDLAADLALQQPIATIHFFPKRLISRRFLSTILNCGFF